MTRFGVLSAAVSVLSASSAAFGCSLCDSERAKEVRAGVFDEGFGDNLLAAVLPFAVLGAVVGAVHFIGRSSTTHDPGGDVAP